MAETFEAGKTSSLIFTKLETPITRFSGLRELNSDRCTSAAKKCVTGTQSDGDDSPALFLKLPGPTGLDMCFYCDDNSHWMTFGPGGGGVGSYNFVDDDNKDAFTEENLKDILKEIVQEALDLRSEKVFSACYKAWFIPVSGLYPIADFEKLSKKSGFECASWNGTYTRP